LNQNRAVHDENQEPKGVNDHDSDDLGKSEAVAQRAGASLGRLSYASDSEGVGDRAADAKAQVFDSRGQLHGGKAEPRAIDVFA